VPRNPRPCASTNRCIPGCRKNGVAPHLRNQSAPLLFKRHGYTLRAHTTLSETHKELHHGNGVHTMHIPTKSRNKIPAMRRMARVMCQRDENRLQLQHRRNWAGARQQLTVPHPPSPGCAQPRHRGKKKKTAYNAFESCWNNTLCNVCGNLEALGVTRPPKRILNMQTYPARRVLQTVWPRIPVRACVLKGPSRLPPRDIQCGKQCCRGHTATADGWAMPREGFDIGIPVIMCG